ncbi:unnamed protein product [Parascedosporium putredinis]|uniref:Uncharacterized protein n=1 Tax=Parascedosporium putredinis TaxID=1442378 RepID=A0A9P1HAJ0_9PEZI|nr:unnamed protein product [Parascedosporium putredinis]CAI8002799.1 unnamed protein product [Parascedosporium putredinis]
MMTVKNELASLKSALRVVGNDIISTKLELRANRYNAIVRMENMNATKRECKLARPKDIKTNEFIPNFPETVGEITLLSGEEADRILSALGFSESRDVRDKRVLVQRVIGMPISVECMEVDSR